MELNIKIGKKGLITAAILLIALAVYNVLFFVIPFDRTHSSVSFWVTYGFTTFLVIFDAVIVFLGLKDKNIKSRIFGIPLLKLAYAAVVTQFVIDAVVMSVGNFFAIPAWAVTIVEVLLFAYVLIALIVRAAYKDHIAKIDSYENKESFIKELRIEVSSLIDATKDKELKKELENLSDLVRYTDPVSSKEVTEIEDEIIEQVSKLKNELNDGDNASVVIKKIIQLIKERKNRLQAGR